MARNAIRAGLRVLAWNVPIAAAEALEPDGAITASTPASAAAEADLVVTMVPNANAIESFATGSEGFLPAMPERAVWIQMSTVGVHPSERLISLAAEYGVTLIDAPVLGSRGPAGRGDLIILASGGTSSLDLCEPFFAAISKRVLRLGSVGAGSRMKMVTNSWIMTSVVAIAETMALASGLGLDGRDFLQAIEGTAMDMGYAQTKGEMMISGDYRRQMTLSNGAKDARLATDAARELGLKAQLASAAADLMRDGCDLGYSEEDMAAVYHAARQTG